VREIFGKGLLDLRCTAELDNWSRVVDFLDFELGVKIDSLAVQGNLGGNWNRMFLNNVVGTITGQDLQIDLLGNVRDIFRQNFMEIDLRTHINSFNYLEKILDQYAGFDGVTRVNTKLLGRLRGNLELKDVEIVSESSEFLLKAEGFVRGLNVSDRSKDVGVEARFAYQIDTDDIRKLSLAILDHDIPIDGSGSVEGLLIRTGNSYRIDNLVLAADTPELTLRAVGKVDALGETPRFEAKFEMQTDRLKDFLTALDHDIPIDGSGSVEGLLIRTGNSYRIDNLVLAADTPELTLRAVGKVDALGETPELYAEFRALSPDLGALSRVWNWDWPFAVGIESEAVGLLKVVDGTVVMSDLELSFMEQAVSGYFSGRLPLVGYSGLADWSLRLKAEELGQLANRFGTDWNYPSFGELNFQVRPSDKENYVFHVQGGLLTKNFDLNISGETTGFDEKSGLNMLYSMNSSGLSEKDDILLWEELSLIESFDLTGSLNRIAGEKEPVEFSLRLDLDRVGSVLIEGVFPFIETQDFEFRMLIELDLISKFTTLGLFELADVGPFRGEVNVRLDAESILLKDFYFRAGENDIFGEIEYRRAVGIGARPEIQGRIESSYLNLNELLPPPKRVFLFGEEPLPIGWAVTHDVDVQIYLDHFLRRSYDLRELTGNVTSLAGRISAYSDSSAFGGDLKLQLNLDTQSKPYKTVYQYDWNNLDLALLPAVQKSDRKISGRVNLRAGISGTGASLHQIVERGDGYLFVDFEKARFLRGGMELFTTSPINIAEQILREVSPWAQRKKFFEIECGVIGMKIENGVGRSLAPPDHTIAVKAKEFRLAGFGDLQLSDESLNISVRSKARGLGMSATTLIEQSGLSTIYSPLYRIVGTLLRPQVESDPEGSDLIETGVKLGAAWATGGTSVVLLSLIDRLAIEPVGCEGARERARGLVPTLFP
jgi:hypothetical protein